MEHKILGPDVNLHREKSSTTFTYVQYTRIYATMSRKEGRVPTGLWIRSHCSNGSEFWSQLPEAALCPLCLLWNVKNFLPLTNIGINFYKEMWRFFPFSLVFIFFLQRKVKNFPIFTGIHIFSVKKSEEFSNVHWYSYFFCKEKWRILLIFYHGWGLCRKGIVNLESSA